MMFSKKMIFLFVLIGMVLMAACTGNGQDEPLPADGDNAASGSQMVGSDIVGEWTLVSLNGHSLVDGSSIIAIFDGSQITGIACNSYFGSYTIGADGLSFGGLGSTEMYCEETMDQEQEYLEALADINDWEVEGTSLALYGSTATLIFEQVIPTPDVNLEGTTWALESFVIGGDAVTSLIADTSITATIASGEISGNATCNDYSGTVGTRGGEISFGEFAVTEMDCEIGMDQENLYLFILASVNRWQIDGDILTLTADNADGLIFRKQ